ncbi:MAG: hypothetical protein ACR2OO_12185 [Thermomicrobiales bacterium]
MDEDRFDHLSRAIAIRSTRRQAIGQAGRGGMLAGVAAMFGVGRRAAGAVADNDTSVTTCTLSIVAKVTVGKDKAASFDGDVTFEIGATGAIDSGRLKLKNGTTHDLVGQISGRAINLRVSVADGQFLSMTGDAQQDAKLCRGGIDGTFGGPGAADLGTWSAFKTKKTGGPPSAAPTAPAAAPTIAGGSGGGGNSGGGGGTSGGGGGNGGGNPTPNPTPCGPVDCGGTLMLDPATCLCVCYDNGVHCGDSCCPTGSVCGTGSTNCSCPSGTELCGNACVASCQSGQYLDSTSCQCVDNPTGCPQGQTLCNQSCISTTCPANQIFDGPSCQCIGRCESGMDYCGGVCISITSDTSNCGFCGNTCPANMPCIGGTCECPFSYTYCAARLGCITEGGTC